MMNSFCAGLKGTLPVDITPHFPEDIEESNLIRIISVSYVNLAYFHPCNWLDQVLHIFS